MTINTTATNSKSIKSTAITIDGPIGSIEALLECTESTVANKQAQFISINCHPHSLHGGTLTNKVVHTLARTMAGLGIPSLRFNFRGVGKSQGEYDDGQGEQQDLAAVIDWMQQRYPNAKLIVSGFSFGAYVSCLAANKIDPDLLVSVAPPVKRFDFSNFKVPNCPWHVIMGDADELVDYHDVVDWFEHLQTEKGSSHKANLITMNQASHFFHGRLIELKQHLESVVTDFMQTDSI
jgi:uncharacterized protein